MKKIFTLFASSLIAGSTLGQRMDTFGLYESHPGTEDHQDRRGDSRDVLFSLRNMPDYALKASENMRVLDSVTRYQWDETASGWMNYFKGYFIYNQYGQIVEWYNREWVSTSGAWEPYDRETHEYDEEGNLAVFTDHNLSEQGDGWYSSWKREYAYEDGRLIGYAESQKDNEGESFYPVWLVEYLYDDQDRVSGTREYIYTFSWKETWRSEYVYDDNGNLLTYTVYDESETDPDGWVYRFKDEYEYNQDGHLTLFEEYDWDESEEIWLNADREEYHPSASGNIDRYIDFNWDDSEEMWVRSWKRENTYDENYGYEQLVLPWFYHDDIPNFFNNLMTEYNTFDYEGGEWIEGYRGNYHFSGSGTTGLTMEKPGNFSFYPNPAGSTVTLMLDDRRMEYRLEVFDLTGKNLLSRQVRSHQPVDVSQLSEGIYLMRVSDMENNPVGIEKILIRE